MTVWNVQYTCVACGEPFTLTQGDPEPDEDVTYCRLCTDVMFDSEEHGTFDDPWTPELIKAARRRESPGRPSPS